MLTRPKRVVLGGHGSHHAQILDYYETMLRIAETEDIKIQVRPDEMRGFIAAAKAASDPERIVRAINEEEVRLVRLAGRQEGVTVPEIRAAFARLRAAAAP
jgi:hypothetical protein